MRHLRAILVLLAGWLMWLFGAPGLDFMKVNDFDTEMEQEALREQQGALAAEVAIALHDFNREVRMPAHTLLEDLQRPFRLAQNWNLYRDGPSRVRRLEILVDGVLKHRSADPSFDWLVPEIRNRRIRPMAESIAIGKDPKNWRGLVRFATTRAVVDFPGCEKVELQTTAGRFPGVTSTVIDRYMAVAPEWSPVDLSARNQAAKPRDIPQGGP